MRRVAEVAVLQAISLPSKVSASLSVLTLADWTQVSRIILDGTSLAAMGGLYETDWMWHALTHDKLHTHLVRGQVLAARDEAGAIAAVAIVSEVDPDDQVLPVGHVDGAESHVAVLALELRQRAAALQAAKVEVMLPAGSPLLRAFVQAGYEPEDEGGTAFCIYELDLKGATR